MIFRPSHYRIAYMSFTGMIPSRKADAVCVMNMCSALASLNLSVDLIIPKGKASQLSELNYFGDIWGFYGLKKNFSIRYLPNPFKRFNQYINKTGFSLLALMYAFLTGRNVINARQPDLAVVAANFGKVVVFESHDFSKDSINIHFPELISILKKPQRKCLLVVTTKACKKSYLETGVPEDRIKILPNGVELERYDNSPSKEEIRKILGLPVSKTIVGFSGNLYEGRGVEEIFFCAEVLEHLHFLIVGGFPEDVDKYTSLIKSKKIKNIQLTGFVRQPMVSQFLVASDILLMPYTTVSAHPYMSPMKLFDYLAAAKPIVATDFPVVREILIHEHNAYIVLPDSGEELVRGIRWVIENPDKAGQMAQQAMRDVNKYTWQTRALEYISFLKTVF